MRTAPISSFMMDCTNYTLVRINRIIGDDDGDEHALCSIVLDNGMRFTTRRASITTFESAQHMIRAMFSGDDSRLVLRDEERFANDPDAWRSHIRKLTRPHEVHAVKRAGIRSTIARIIRGISPWIRGGSGVRDVSA